MFNNAIDHSEATEIDVHAWKNAVFTEVEISDNGIGIFKKIQRALHLSDENAAIVELAKGKFTTDSSKHSGEGIFFTSKMFDSFDIVSGHHSFLKNRGSSARPGTMVWMKLANDSVRHPQDIYNEFTDDDFKFEITKLPVRLAQYGGQNLVSRSQAKRIMSRMEKFKSGTLDFAGVDYIGQAFADQIFRVFRASHPDFELKYVNAEPEVAKMIRHVEGNTPA